MSDTEKQEGQKTVVAFIAGLLIGGLLVWVFSSSPEGAPTDIDAGGEAVTGTAEPTNTNSTITNNATAGVKKEESPTVAPKPKPETIREGVLTVVGQPAGAVVVLDTVTFPTATGWIAVRDYTEGTAGKILGAARFNEAEGLNPASVNLLRNTEAGKSYQVVYYSENGDKVFDLSDDLLIEGVSSVFEAK